MEENDNARDSSADLSQIIKAILDLNPSLAKKGGSVFGLEPLSTELGWALYERLQYLEPILNFLEKECTKIPQRGLQDRGRDYFMKFDKRMVLNILLMCFVTALIAKEQLKRIPTQTPLKQKKKDLFSVLRWKLEPETLNALKHEFLMTEVNLILQNEWKKWMSKKCPATSDAIDTLAAYFLKCAPLRVIYAAETKVFWAAGIIVQAFVNPPEILAPYLSTPRTCLVCEKEHSFSGWRAIRARTHKNKKRGD